MVANIEIPVNKVKNLTTYTIPSVNEREFPLLSIDIDSYIVQAKIETGINFDWDGGVHNI